MLRIKRVMRERGTTQGELSRRTAISYPTVNRTVNGKSSPKPRTARLMALALRWPVDMVDELFEEDE